MALILDGTTGIVANNIADYAISTAKLANSAITTAKIGYAGAVLQVVQAQSTTTITTTTTTYSDLMSASITPTSSTSKIFAIWSMGIFTTAGAIPELQLVRNSTSISVNGFWGHINGGGAYILNYPASMYLDSPATTSSTTYKLQGRTRSGTVNWMYTDGNGQLVGTLTLMEIAG